MTAPQPLVLVAHGSRDPRAAPVIEALVRDVARLRPHAPVAAAFLDHAGPRVDRVLTGLASRGATGAVVVPLLLTSAYHHRVDLPAVLADARRHGPPMAVTLADTLGPLSRGVVAAPLVAALRHQLAVLGQRFDAVVLVAAGTAHAPSRTGIRRVASALGEALRVPAVAAFASAAGPRPGVAVSRLRAAGARRVAVASYFLAPGLLYDAAVDDARSAGAVAVAAPLGRTPHVPRLVLRRAAESAQSRWAELPRARAGAR
ncbi:cobalamin biosynthesis protein [Pilimelia anulata]|uniref:Cobalamin biosynthesis protein n=1 Tax=Pilimelia anulata TaxID=53371 RepID=A0A8J3FAZ4_9ACTN|nr:CbiX/SirB N-terminal domain-containing protein [Pilimelia anulata]GGJ79063.1 cobalamin biosynthesis protein [Pilimelia anulata]